MITQPALRYHGAKFRLAKWVMGFFPDHVTYVEPFGGAAGVLLQKPRAYAEIYNDLDGEIVNFFRVLRDPESREQLIQACVLTPYAREEFQEAWLPSDDPVERARRLCIRAQMGFGSAGATKGTTGFRIDSRREYGTAQQLWTLYPSGISDVGIRMQGVLIENRPAIEIMQQHDGPRTLHFVDPPYMHETRVQGNRTYKHEMSYAEHVALIAALHALQGMVILCGYPSKLYTDSLKNWVRHEKLARISAGRGTALRTEVLWLNPACAEALESQSINNTLFK